MEQSKEIPADQQPQQVRVPIPAVPLPLNFLFGIVKLREQPVILATAMTDAGAMVQGFFSPEMATKLGRDLIKAGRQAELETPSKLQVVTKGGLVVPGA